MSYSVEIITLILGFIGGGALFQLITMRAQKKKASAEASLALAGAESSELDNVEKAVRIWRDTAQSLEKYVEKYDEVVREVAELKKTIDTLNRTNRKILKLLEKISPDNIEGPVQQIKEEISNAGA